MENNQENTPDKKDEGEVTNLNGLNPDFDFGKFGIGNLQPTETLDHINQLIQQSIGPNKETTGEDLLLTDIKEIPCLVEPFLQRTGLACLAGSSDTGKSSLLRQLVISIVAGESHFLGFKINSVHKSAIYVSTEDGNLETAYLLRRQSVEYSPPALKDLRFLFDTDKLLNELEKRLTYKPADLVVIDCFGDAFSGDLKDSQKIRTYLHPFQQLAQKHQCLILFLHHTGKRTENFEPSKNNLLSGQGFEAKMRLVIELRADLVRPNYRHLCIVKGNYLPANFKKESYLLDFNEQNFTFTNTGERVPFELLVKQQEGDNDKLKFEQALELKNQGNTYEQIAGILGYKSKGSISKLIDRGEKNSWCNKVSSVSDGNDKETP